MKQILFTTVFVYMGISLIMYISQRNLLYFPTSYTKIEGTKEVYFESNSYRLQGWVVNKGQEKALIYYGGNAENIEQNIDFFKKQFMDRTVYLINYRGYGKSEGNPTQDNLFKDALNIFDNIKTEYKTVSLMGRSLGSGVASYVASQREIEKLVLVTPFDSILNVAKDAYMLLPVSLLLKDKFESINYVQNINAKTLIVYGAKDEVINSQRTENLIKAFKKDHLDIILIQNANHNDITLFNEYTDSLANFLNQ